MTELRSHRARGRTELCAELLRIENLMLFLQVKQLSFPAEYGTTLVRLSDRREQIAALLRGA